MGNRMSEGKNTVTSLFLFLEGSDSKTTVPTDDCSGHLFGSLLRATRPCASSKNRKQRLLAVDMKVFAHKKKRKTHVQYFGAHVA